MPQRTLAPRPLSDAEIKERTGKTWDEWFKTLDKFGGVEKGRREIGYTLHGKPGVDAWLSATIVVEYEAARGVLEPDGRPKGYMICPTKTIAAPVDAAYRAWATDSGWNSWFAKKSKIDLRVGGRYSTGDGDAGEFTKVRENKVIRFTWENPKHTPGTVVEATFKSKGDGNDKCIVMVSHDRIQTRAEADDLRDAWTGVLNKLKAVLENGHG
jgi:uncharacterized protein YndB with AHSA1/START domain